MRSDFGEDYLITIAAPASYWYLRHFKIGEMSKYLDFINVMTYDIHGTWDAGIESLGPFVNSHTNIEEVEEGFASSFSEVGQIRLDRMYAILFLLFRWC